MTAEIQVALAAAALLSLLSSGGDEPGSTPPAPQAGPARARTRGGARAPELPRAYQAYPDPQGHGQVLIAQQQRARSPRDLLTLALDDLETYFDDRPEIRGAFADRPGRQMQAMFVACLEGVPVEGVVTASLAEPEGTLVVVYDQPQALAQSLPRLMGIAQEKLQPSNAGREARGVGEARDAREAQEAPAENWRQWPLVQLPDGSGTVRLPQGWQITSSNMGMAELAGPQGAQIALGIWVPVNAPGSGIPLAAGQMFIAPYCAPADALVALWPQWPHAGPAPRLLRIVEQTPIEWPNAQAAYVHWESESPQADPMGGVRMQKRHALSLILTTPHGPAMWTYYFTQVSAPEPVFGQLLPTMLQIWQSWKMSDAMYLQRMNQALANLREVQGMLHSGYEERERVAANAHADWTEALRGERYERDTLTGELRTQPLHNIRDIVEAKNRQEGYQRYEEVPLRDLNR